MPLNISFDQMKNQSLCNSLTALKNCDRKYQENNQLIVEKRINHDISINNITKKNIIIIVQ